MEFEQTTYEPQRLLLVDDDPTVLALTSEFLKTLGMEFHTARNGKEALKLLEGSPFTIIITDLIMPVMDGMSLIKVVKTKWPDIDIVVMTGHGREFSYTSVIKAGASDFIQKPFNFDELKAKLNRIIRERNLRALLKRLSLRDPLTDLYNRRFFEEKLEEEAERSARQNYPLFLIMVDLDNFKFLNDSKGHQQGDKILRYLAQILKASTRNHVDTICRYGGDEFVITIPQASVEQALQIAERIRTKYLEGENMGTTLSIGISRFRRTDKPLRDDLYLFLREADEAMYSAKRAGGNKVVLHPSVEKESQGVS